jgi:arabinogalactan endo-1,4-beta-galactosidase
VILGQILANNLNLPLGKILTFPELLEDVYAHTYDVIDAKSGWSNPEWVQVGNEIPGGMMWPEGSTRPTDTITKQRYEATKAIDPKLK